MEDENTCRICHSLCNDEESYCHPCKCKGSLKYIHVTCLKDWLTICKNKKCDICHYPFIFTKKYKSDTPKYISIYLVLTFISKKMMSSFVDLLCILYQLIKFGLVVFINGFFGSLVLKNPLVYNTEFLSKFEMLSISLFFTLFSFLKLDFFKKVLRIISSLRVSLNPGALQNGSDSSVTETEDGPVQSREESSQSNISDDMALNINDFSGYSISSVFLVRPSLDKLSSDCLKILGLTFSSILYFFISYSGHILSKRFLKDGFLSKILLDRFYCEIFIAILVCSVFCAFCRFASDRFDFVNFRTGFYLFKGYLLIFLNAILIQVSLGVYLHGIFSSWLYKNEYLKMSNIFITDYKISILFHFFIGTLLSEFMRHIKSFTEKKFRKGFIQTNMKNQKMSSIIEYYLKIDMFLYFRKITSTIALLILFPYILVTFNNIIIKLIFKTDLIIKNEIDKFFMSSIILKIVLMYAKNLKKMAKNISWLIAASFKICSRILGCDNYIFNKKTIIDRERLVWDLNCKLADIKYIQFIREINNKLKTKEVTLFGTKNINEIDQDSTDIRTTTFNYNKDDNILDKYSITNRRIEKYFGKEHNRRISIFYKSKWVNICIVLSLILFAFAMQCIFTGSYLISLFAVRKISFFSNFEGMAVILGFVSLFTFFLSINYSEVISNMSIICSLIKILYFNVLFPAIFALGYVFLYSQKYYFAQFSLAFLAFFSVSNINLLVFESILQVPIEQNIISIVVNLFSHLLFNLSIYSLIAVNSRLLYFSSKLLPTILLIFIAGHLFKIFKSVLTGQMMTKIKDYFYLEDTAISNYDE